MAKFSINDLFDFSNVQKLDELNQKYETLDKTLDQFSKNLQSNVSKNIKLIDAWEKELMKLGATAEKDAQAIMMLDKAITQLNNNQNNLLQQQKQVNTVRAQVTKESDKARKSLSELEKVEKRLADATGKDAEELAKLRLQLQEARKETKQNAKEALGLVSAYDKLAREAAQAKREAKNLGAELGTSSKEYQIAAKRADDLNQSLKDIDAGVGDFQRNVGNYSSALDGIKQGFGSIIEFATPAGLALAAVTVAIEGIGALAETVQETNQQLKDTALLTKLSGDELTNFTAQVRATSKAFDVEYRDVLKAANTITKEFGVTGAEALDLINQGFVQGANINDDYLDQLREYSTQFKAAGLEAQNLIQITALGAQEGIFNDKAVDVVKEGGLRLREFTKATQDALVPLGELRNEQIKQAVAAGNSFEAIQLVSKGLQEVNLSAQQTQGIITNVFGGPGEDAGQRFIELLATVDTSQKSILANLTEQQKQQLRILEVENELANAEVRLGEAFKSSGKEISIFFKQLQTLGIEFLIDIINEGKEAIEELTPLFEETTSEVQKLFDAFDFGGSSLLKFFKGFNPIVNEIERATQFVRGFLNVLNFLLGLFNDFISVIKLVGNELIDFARSFEFVDTAIKSVTILYSEFINTFSDTPNLLSGVSAAFTEFFNQIQTRFRRFLLNIKDGVKGVLTFDLGLIVQSIKSQGNLIEGAGVEIAKAFERGYNQGPTIEKTVKKDVEETAKVIEKAQKEQAAQTKDQRKKDAEAQDKALEQRLKKVTDAATKERIRLKDERANQLITEEQFQDELLLLRLGTLEKQKEALEAAGKDTLAIEEQINDLLLQEQKKGERLGLEQEKAAAKESLMIKKQSDKDKLQAEKDAKEKRQALLSDPITQAALDGLESRIQNELLLAGVQAFRTSLEQGNDAQTALLDGTKAVAAAQVFKSLSRGFHDGGYTGDGGEWDTAGVVHKGEHVITKKQTAKYGIKGLSANDFDTAVESGYFNQFAKTNAGFSDQMNLKGQIVVNNNNNDVVQAINNLPNKMPTETLKPLAGHLQHEQKINNITKRTTFRNTGRTAR